MFCFLSPFQEKNFNLQQFISIVNHINRGFEIKHEDSASPVITGERKDLTSESEVC